MSPSGKTYAYIRETNLESSSNSNLSVTAVRAALIEQPRTITFDYIFSEEDSGRNGKGPKNAAFHMMLNVLKPGDVVWIYSPYCLMSTGRPEFLLFDVLDSIRILQELGASIYFVRENWNTSSAEDRLILTQTLATAQYHLDKAILKITQTPTCSDCSSSKST